MFLIIIPVLPVFTESEIDSKTSMKLAISSLPEAKLTFSQDFKVPFMQGEGMLVSGNNIKFGLDAEITPISMGLLGRAVFTPIAFLEFSAGGMIGSGWNIELFGSEVRGIGINVSDTGKTSVDGSAFDGAFLGSWFGGAFQFDTGAVFPGDWNHVLIRTSHELSCRMYSRAGADDPWFFESDHGENQNGWNYLGTYILGYQLPLFLNTVAFQAEMFKYLYDTPESGQWGGAKGRWDFGLIMNFSFTERFSTMLVTQFRLYRNYENFEYGIKDKDNPDYNRYYRERILDDGRTLKFYRVAAIMNYKLR